MPRTSNVTDSVLGVGSICSACSCSLDEHRIHSALLGPMELNRSVAIRNGEAFDRIDVMMYPVLRYRVKLISPPGGCYTTKCYASS